MSKFNKVIVFALFMFVGTMGARNVAAANAASISGSHVGAQFANGGGDPPFMPNGGGDPPAMPNGGGDPPLMPSGN
jgi:hypothetical protein